MKVCEIWFPEFARFVEETEQIRLGVDEPVLFNE